MALSIRVSDCVVAEYDNHEGQGSECFNSKTEVGFADRQGRLVRRRCADRIDTRDMRNRDGSSIYFHGPGNTRGGLWFSQFVVDFAKVPVFNRLTIA